MYGIGPRPVIIVVITRDAHARRLAGEVSSFMPNIKSAGRCPLVYLFTHVPRTSVDRRSSELVSVPKHRSRIGYGCITNDHSAMLPMITHRRTAAQGKKSINLSLSVLKAQRYSART